jgi:hypothetical protein
LELDQVVGPIVPYTKRIYGGVIEHDGQIVGHGFISLIHGQGWLHDLKHWGPEPMALARLYQQGIAEAKKEGIEEFMTEVAPGSSTHGFYLKLGWEEKSMVMRGKF